MNSRGYMMSGRTDFVLPFGGGGNFTGGKSQSQRGMATKRSSQQGKIGGSSKGGKSGRVSISFKEDMKLHETENVWKPARLNNSGAPDTDDDKKTEKFEFLIGNSAKIASICKSRKFTYPQIYDKLMEFIKQDKDKKSTPFDDVSTWITANIGDDTKEEEFVRTLATVIIECSITSAKLDADQLRSLYPYFHKYIDSQPAFELQCLYAIQSIVNKLDHPQWLLLNLFNTLCEDNIISHDSFIYWEQSDDPQGQEKKGVALKQLTSFFTQLKENDEDSGGSSGSEEPYTAD